MAQNAQMMETSDLKEAHWSILKTLAEDDGLPANLLWENAGISKQKFYYHIDTLRALNYVEKPAHGFYKLGDEAPVDDLPNHVENDQ